MKRKSAVSFLLAIALMLTLIPAYAETSANTLLQCIDLLAPKGWIINASYTVAKDTYGDIENDIGAADESAYVASAKGTYYTFDEAKFVAGTNKGDQIFELRSFDDRLSAIKLKDVTGYFGTPDHETKTKTERFLSYKVTDDLNLKFVFPTKGSNPTLSHYCVFYPAGTINMMADDPGRQW